jgi:spermidine synthase
MKSTQIIASTVARDGSTLVLQEHDGEYVMRIDGSALMSTTASTSEQTMAELGCAGLESAAPRVLIGGLGFGFTLRRVLELVPADARVIVSELFPVIVEWNRIHLGSVNGELLDDARVAVKIVDVYYLLKGSSGRGFDTILLDVDNSPDPLVQEGNARLYSKRGLRMIQEALTEHGKVVFWSSSKDKRFEESLRKFFHSVEAVPAKSYPQ